MSQKNYSPSKKGIDIQKKNCFWDKASKLYFSDTNKLGLDCSQFIEQLRKTPTINLIDSASSCMSFDLEYLKVDVDGNVISLHFRSCSERALVIRDTDPL